METILAESFNQSTDEASEVPIDKDQLIIFISKCNKRNLAEKYYLLKWLLALFSNAEGRPSSFNSRRWSSTFKSFVTTVCVQLEPEITAWFDHEMSTRDPIGDKLVENYILGIGILQVYLDSYVSHQMKPVQNIKSRKAALATKIAFERISRFYLFLLGHTLGFGFEDHLVTIILRWINTVANMIASGNTDTAIKEFETYRDALETLKIPVPQSFQIVSAYQKYL